MSDIDLCDEQMWMYCFHCDYRTWHTYKECWICTNCGKGACHP